MGQTDRPEEKQRQLQRARKRIDTANKLRLTFLFIAVVLLVVIYFGNKLWEGLGWYDSFVSHSYAFLLWDILLMLAATFAKLFFTVRHNKMVKGL